nr:MAG TPA: hypothetical protein [Caudoviricetes sp.]
MQVMHNDMIISWLYLHPLRIQRIFLDLVHL